MDDDEVKILDMVSYKERTEEKALSLNRALAVREAGIREVDASLLDAYIGELLQDLADLKAIFDDADVVTYGEDANVFV